MTRTILAVVLVAAVACGNDSTGTTTGQVSVVNNSFQPPSIQPDENSRVTWTWNSGGTLHNVTFEDLTPGSSDLGTGTFTRTFTGAPSGTTFRYRCTLHSADFSSGMVGQVVIP